MWFTATVYAYDALDSVIVSARVRLRADDPLDGYETVCERQCTLPGVGEADGTLWLKDALVGLLETL